MDYYKVSMNLTLPRVYDNMSSQGYRAPHRETIVGTMKVDWLNPTNTKPVVTFSTLTNRNHKVSSGKLVTYEVYDRPEAPLLVFLGSNKTGVFRRPGIDLELILNPSYNIGVKELQDNTLYVELSGYGKYRKTKEMVVAKSFTGNVVGRMGCGCAAYSHLSPTRFMTWWGYGLMSVTDIAPLHGTFRLTWDKKRSRKDD